MHHYLPENILVCVAAKEGERGKDIGKEFTKHSKRYFRSDVAIHINKNNLAIGLFEKHGFEERNIEVRLTR